VFTIGAGYLNIAAALASTDLANGNANSPAATFDSSSGNVYLVYNSAAVWVRRPPGVPAPYGAMQQFGVAQPFGVLPPYGDRTRPKVVRPFGVRPRCGALHFTRPHWARPLPESN